MIFVEQYIIDSIDQMHVVIFAGALHQQVDPVEIGTTLNQVISTYSLELAQIFDNRYVWGHRHLKSAIWHAYQAFTTSQLISKTLSMEVLLYIAGMRQIQKALRLVGVRSATPHIAGVLGGGTHDQLVTVFKCLQDTLNFQADVALLEDLPPKREFLWELLTTDVQYQRTLQDFSNFDIEKAVLQRIALLALEEG